MIKGTTNVGGIAGANSGALNNVMLISTSDVPSVSETASSVGGIVGTTSGMYLAVAPRTGTTLHPFTGDNANNTTIGDNVGANRYYLSGSRAIRPTSTAIPATVIEYNHLANRPDEARTTLEIVTAARGVQRFGNWGIIAVGTPTQDSDRSNTTSFPYPFPNGTVRPVDWPLAANIDLTNNPSIAIVY
jgi:hypothetical protein